MAVGEHPNRSRRAPGAPTLREVFEAEVAFVFRALRRLGVPENDLEDAAQDVFVVVHRKLTEFEGGTPIRSWLFGIARRVAAARRRRGYARHEVSTNDIEVDGAEGNCDPEFDARALLEAALSKLDAAKREVFMLYELEGLPMQEVALAVGCPLQTAYSRLHAARALVRSELAPLLHRKSS
jgi:RNA polymerase sigma-70 factor, ECF subfamily